MKYKIIIILVLLSLNSFAQKTKKQSLAIKQIDSLMNDAYKHGIFNGNVLVAKNNKIIYKQSFGFSNAEKSIKLTNDYRFNIGSTTKEFSAVALMQLKEKGKLNLEDTVSKFLPEFPDWANKVSIKDLLQFTSGIPNVIWKNIKNDQDLFDGLKNVESLDFEPGEKYDYNNSNIFLRHIIIEKITGMSYKKYVEKFIFKPSKMKTAMLTPFANENKVAQGFNNKLENDKADLPITGGTYLTTSDLLKWSKMLNSNKIISKKSVVELGKHFNQPEVQSALGETKFDKDKLAQHLHHGRSGNFEAMLFADEKEKITIIFLDNNYNGKIHQLTDEIKAILAKQ